MDWAKTNLSTRLQYLMDQKKINPADLVESSDFTFSQISKWMSGNVKRISSKNSLKLATYFDCDKNWLRDGEGSPFRTGRTGDMIITGDANIQAGGKISGTAFVQNKPEQIQLDQDEFELIKELREVGGKMMIKKFRKQLDELKKIIEGGKNQ